jgi:succinyl-CoA synthetase beta subunit
MIEFKVGDIVTCEYYGEGVVESIGGFNCKHPVIVRFNSSTQAYTFTGLYTSKSEYKMPDRRDIKIV